MDNKIAVFIDSENINYKDYTYISKELKTAGTIIVYNIYGDWNDDNSYNWIDISITYGINKIQVDKIAGKESVDHKICVDMMEYLHTNKHIDIFYLITSDSDYRHVIHKIKEYNKKVYCIGNNPTTSCLVPVCNKYTQISVIKMKEQFGKITSPVNKSKIQIKSIKKMMTINQDNIDKNNIEKNNIDNIDKNNIDKNDIDKNDIEKYKKTIRKILNVPYGSYNLSYINDILKNTHPEYNYKLYNTDSFKKFLEKYYGDFIKIDDHRNGSFAKLK